MEVFTLEADESMPKATGVRLVERGLSYPLEAAPRAYTRAFAASTQGIHQETMRGLGKRVDLSPWVLKRLFAEEEGRDRAGLFVRGEWSTDDGASVSCRVTDCADHLNEANLFILKSLIPGAGLGLFLRPTPPGRRRLHIPSSRVICLYSRRPMARDQSESQLSSTDYLMESRGRGMTIRFNPEVYTGEETGRFVNQGGLMEGLEALCRACDRDQGMTGYAPGDVERELARHCSVRFERLRHSVLNVVAAVELVSSESVQELLVNYTIDYWVRYVVANLQAIQTSNPRMADCVLWTLLSRHSCYEGGADLLGDIPNEIRDRYANRRCPVAPRSGRGGV